MLRWIIIVIAVIQTACGLPTYDNPLAIMNNPKSGFILHLLKNKYKHPTVQKIVTPQPASNCICVPYYQCSANNTVITDGKGVIDIRFLAVTLRKCTTELEICCGLPSSPMAPIVIPTTVPTTMMVPKTTAPPPPTTTTAMPTTTTTTMKPTTQPPTSPPTTMPPTTTTTMKPTPPPTMATTSTTMKPTQPATTMKPPSPTSSPTSNCVCVTTDQCDANGFIIVGGEGLINPRQTQQPCPTADQICCKIPPSLITQTTKQQPEKQTTVAPNPPIVQPVGCVCVPLSQCDANGYVIVSGMGTLNPRLRRNQSQALVVSGSCSSANEICCKLMETGQDSAIGFPTTNYPGNPVVEVIKNAGTDRACVCVKSWQCAEGCAVSIDGSGIIDPRFDACPMADEVCCRFHGVTRIIVAAENPLVHRGGPSVVIVNTNVAASEPSTSAICGIRSTACLSDRACATEPGEASFAEFPWMVALFVRKPGETTLLFQCGASIINTQSVLTAAHCVIDRPQGALVARFGEWNTANNDEPAPYQEVDVQAVVTHPLYYNGGLYNDVAVLILAKPINYAINVMPICLPQQGMTFSPGTRCWASGWGRSAFEGQYQTILRKVELPTLDRTDCQTRLRSTRLGQYFRLHESFMCAGGEPNKDTCRGDGGGPLVCPTASGQFVQAGIVSWGIGCGESNVPAVYASVSLFRQWIDRQLANHGVL